jgi:hypothetical protein
MDSYFETYLSQFFTTMGQLSAVAVSSSIAIPMYSFYLKRYFSQKDD